MFVSFFIFFFFNDTATTEIYTLSLHDALPIYGPKSRKRRPSPPWRASPEIARRPHGAPRRGSERGHCPALRARSEEHTSELQSRQYLVCRLLLEKKKNTKPLRYTYNCNIIPL